MLNYLSILYVQSCKGLLYLCLLLIEHNQQHTTRKFFGYIPPMFYVVQDMCQYRDIIFNLAWNSWELEKCAGIISSTWKKFTGPVDFSTVDL
jgi:hypothetical protein